MSIKISPFNVHTINRYGLKKLEEMDRKHKAKKLKLAEEAEKVEEVAEEIVVEVAEPEPEVVEEPVVEEAALPEWEEEPIVEEVAEEAKVSLESLSEGELRELAKSLNIDYWWTKGEERLIEEIKEIQGE